MNLLLSDTILPASLPKRQENYYINLQQLSISPCTGCFGCWVKTPGKCVIRDDAPKIYPLIAKSKRLLYVSRLFYGGYDIPMKTLLERSIPIQQAFIRLHHGETHHVQRDVVEKDAIILEYGAIPQEEQDLFRRYIARNASNTSLKSWNILFVEEAALESTIQKEVLKWENS